MNKFYIVFLLIAIAFSSCTDNTYYENKKVFKDSDWKRFDHVKFNIPVKTEDTLDFDLVFTYNARKFNKKVLPVNITFYTPSKEMRTMNYRFKLFDYEHKKRKGEIKGDTVKVKLHVRNGFSFSKPGILKMEIENRIPRTDNYGIISLELKVKKE